MDILKRFKRKRDFFNIEELTYDDHIKVSMNVSNDVLEIMGEIIKGALDNVKEKEEDSKNLEMYRKYIKKRETGE